MTLDPSTTTFVERIPSKRQLRKSRLVVLEGKDRGRELVVERERITVGRSVVSDLVLTDSAVSGNHCEIVAVRDGFRLRDLDSTNGTFISDVRIHEAHLVPGAFLRVGESVLKFEGHLGHVEIDASKNDRFFELVGKSQRMREIFAVLEKVAPTDLTVLVRGETGTGKELVARAIHRASHRAKHPLVVQDCSAIPTNLIEDTLFGHERGAFTGAHDRHRGSFEQADSGTIFLDEIGELDRDLQPKLLRVLENREIKRVGGDRTVPVNVRVVAATNRDLRTMVNAGTFREDLFYRLGVVQVEMPALRERQEDIPILVQGFLDDFARRHFPNEERKYVVTSDGMMRLLAYPWPGNVRELKNTVERAASLASSLELSARDFTPSSQKTPPVLLPGGTAEHFIERGIHFKDAKQRVLDTFEASYLKVLLEKHGHNVTRSAQAAGLTRYHLRELAKRYGIRGDVDR